MKISSEKIRANLSPVRKSIRFALALSVVAAALALSVMFATPKPMLATPKPAPGAAAPPVFEQALIDEAMDEPMLMCGCTHNRGQRVYHAPVLLALVERLHPNSTSSSGASVAERLAAQIHQFLVNSNPRFPGNQGSGIGWASAAVTAILTMARYTPTVWNLLSADDRNRSDWYMRLAAVVANTRNNEASQCQNSIGLDHSGGSNPNQRPDMRSMSYAWIYFGGADAVNAELAAFDYDTYLNKFQAFGWNANVEEWTKPNVRNMLEHGGSYTLCTVHPDGARRPFTVIRGRVTGSNKACPGWGLAPDDMLLPFTAINMFRREEHGFLYGAEVVDQSCKQSPGTSKACPNEYGRLLSGAPSPHLGKIGMFLEYNINTRSSSVYSAEGAAMGIAHYAVLAALGFWDSGNPEYDEMEDRFWIAMDDARYKNANGWFDNSLCRDADFLGGFHGGRYLFGIWDTMFQDKSIVWSPANPEVDVKYANGFDIADGNTNPNVLNGTFFGVVSVDNKTATRTFTIRNTGPDDLILTGSPIVKLSGNNAADFSVTAQPDASVAPGGSATFQVSFDPSSSGARTATISFGNNDADENPYNFTIMGVGFPSVPSIQNLSAEGGSGATQAEQLKADETSVTTAAVAQAAPFEIHLEATYSNIPLFESTAPYNNTPGFKIVNGGWQSSIQNGISGDKVTILYEANILSGTGNPPLPNETDYKNYVISRVGSGYDGMIWLDIEKSWTSFTDQTQIDKNVTIIRWTQEAVKNAQVAHYYKGFGGGHPTGNPNPPFPESDAFAPIFDQSDILRGGGYTKWVQGTHDNWVRRNKELERARLRYAPGQSKFKPFYHYLTPDYENPNGLTFHGLVEEEVFLQQLMFAKNAGAKGVIIWDYTSPFTPWSTASSKPWWKAVRKFVGIDANSREIEVRENNASGAIISNGAGTPADGSFRDFGGVTAGGSASVTKTFWIKNLGTGILTLGLVNLGGANPNDFKNETGTVDTTLAREPYFAITHGPTGKPMNRLSLLGGQSTTFQIKFDPSSTGVKNATVSIQNNDGNENPFSFSIKGRGN